VALPKIDKWFLQHKRLKKGHGWMQSIAGKLPYPKAPHMRGAFVCSEDYKRGRRLYINAWFYEDERGKVVYFTIASAAERRKMWLKFKQDERERWEESRRKAQALWEKMDAAPKEVERKDLA
jgi:hypothetical protein